MQEKEFDDRGREERERMIRACALANQKEISWFVDDVT